MENNNLLKKNIPKLNLMSFFTNTNFQLVVYTLFLLSKGLSMQQFFIIESAAMLASLIAQIPTGTFSDRVSRKWSLVIASLINAPLIVVIILSHSFWVILVAMALSGIGLSFASGADVALLYDTAKATGNESNFKKISGNFKWYGAWAGAIGGITGGFLAQINMSYAWWAYFIVSLIVLAIQFTLVNPPREQNEHQTLGHHVKTSIWHAFRGEAAFFVIFAAVTWLFFSIGFWLWQPYLKALTIPLLFFGIIYAVIDLISGFVSKQAHKIEKKVGIFTSLMLIPLVLAAAFLFQSFLIIIYGVIFLAIHAVISGYQGPVLEDYLNSRIPSSNRATVISIKNMINDALFVIVSPIIGHLVDLYSLRTTYILMFFALLLVTVVFAIRFRTTSADFVS